MKRFEVWYTNGLFRGYPHVRTETVKKSDDFLSFIFGTGGTHRANINISNVNFIEEMEDDEEK